MAGPVRLRASRLEHTLLGGATAVDLRHFLPAEDASHRRAVLCELVKTELEARYRRGKGQTLERFLESYPELGGRDDVPVSLLYEEYRPPATWRPARAGRLPHPLPPPVRRADAAGGQKSGCAGGDPGRQEPPADPWRNPLGARKPTPPDKPPTPSPPAGQPTRLDSKNPTPAVGKGANLSSSPTDDLGSMSGQVLSHRPWLPKLEPPRPRRVRRGLAGAGPRRRRGRHQDHPPHPRPRGQPSRELKVLEKIRQPCHPFLLQTHQYQAERDHLVIVMELADGSLSDRFKECKTQRSDRHPRRRVGDLFHPGGGGFGLPAFPPRRPPRHQAAKPADAARLRQGRRLRLRCASCSRQRKKRRWCAARRTT